LVFLPQYLVGIAVELLLSLEVEEYVRHDVEYALRENAEESHEVRRLLDLYELEQVENLEELN
jgi:hypothetical protein